MNRARHILIDNTPLETPAAAEPARDSSRDQKKDRASWYAPGLSDGVGDRLLMFDNTGAPSLELLRFKRAFAESRKFEAQLRHRVSQLEGLASPAIAKVRAVEWLGDGDGLALISNHTAGRRLSEVLTEGGGPRLTLELIRQLTPVLAQLHQQGPGIAHGAITADRIIVTPTGRLVLIEHVLGSALESLWLPGDRFRSELGIVLPPGGGVIALNGRTDMAQLAFVALSLLLGRRIHPHEYPEKGTSLLDEFPWNGPRGFMAPPYLRVWLEQALQLGGRSFPTAQEATDAARDLLDGSEATPITAPRTLYAFPRETTGHVGGPAHQAGSALTLGSDGTSSPADRAVTGDEAKRSLQGDEPNRRDQIAESTRRDRIAESTLREEIDRQDDVIDADVSPVTPVRTVGTLDRNSIEVPDVVEQTMLAPATSETGLAAFADRTDDDFDGSVFAGKFGDPASQADDEQAEASRQETRYFEFPRRLPPTESFSSGAENDAARDAFLRQEYGAIEGRRFRILRWVAAGFAILAIGEAGVIAGLVQQQHALRPPAAAAAPPAQSPVTTLPADPLAPTMMAGAPNAPGMPPAGSATQAPAAVTAAAFVGGAGKLDIGSDPAGLRVFVDGVPAGVTPVTLPVPAGAHVIAVTDGKTTTTHNMTVAAGATTTLMASIAAPAPAGVMAGWLTVKAPLDLDVREGGKLLGSTSVDRLMLPAGHHQLDLSNAQTAFQTAIAVDIRSGQTTPASVSVPNGSLSINALPWATVLLDGRTLSGSTPFANLEVALGPHEVVLRHPQFGERRQQVIVTTRAPVRLVVDLSK